MFILLINAMRAQSVNNSTLNTTIPVLHCLFFCIIHTKKLFHQNILNNQEIMAPIKIKTKISVPLYCKVESYS